MIDLELENFQLIREAKLKFEEGLTVITGSNSSGKTAILRSLCAVLLNPVYAKRYIRHGESVTRVRLVMSGHSVEWERKESGVRYTVDGSENNKCGRNTLFDFIENFPLAYEQDTNKILNIQTEHDGLFPFNRSSTEMFRLFEEIFQISDSSAILGSIKKEEQDTNKNLSLLKIKQKEIENKLSCIVDFNNDNSFEILKKHKEGCESTLDELRSLELALVECEKLQSVVDNLNNVDCFYFDSNTIDDIEKYIKLNELCNSANEYNKYNFELDFDRQSNFDLSIISDYIDICDDSIDKLINDLQQCRNNRSICVEQLTEIENELLVIHDKMKSENKCPLCNQIVDIADSSI